MNPLSIRWRMSLWYSAVLAGILAIFGISVYLLMQRGLQNRTNKSLAVQMAVIEDQLTRFRQSSEIRDWLQRQYARHPALDVQVTAADGSIWLRGDRISNAALRSAEGDHGREKGRLR